MQKTGIMGGTFNPVHYAHLALAEFAKERFGLDKVMFLPSNNPVHKDAGDLAGARHRYHMVELAIKDNPDFYVSDLELNRAGDTFTIDTLRTLTSRYKEEEFYFIIGSDSLLQFDKWKDAKEIVKLCRIAAADRGGCDADAVREKARALHAKYHASIQFFEIPHMDISSSNIRERLFNRQTVRYLLPDLVLFYIQSNHLYGQRPNGQQEDE